MLSNSNFLGNRIKEIRLNKNLGVRELARLSSIPHQQILSIEKGQTKNPGIFTIKKIADVLNISIDALLLDYEIINNQRNNSK